MNCALGARRAGLMVTALMAAAPVLALNPGDVVDNFRLVDQKGESRELYYLSDMRAVVLLAQGNGCKASDEAATALQSLRAKHQAQGTAKDVEFLLINSNLGDNREAIAQHVAKAGVDLPVLVDELQLIGESLGMTRNGEALVIDPKTWKVAYQGAGANVGDAVDALLSGAPVKKATSKVKGCAIDMPERGKRAAHAKISYEKTIAPLLTDKCVTCHRVGGIGPWQMTSYEMVKGFSPMIREVVRTERMPPWHADPHYKIFSNDRSLTDEQAKTLVHWIEAGAPRGEGKDPLKELPTSWPEWALGEPDLVVSMPSFTVPATGVIPYQMVKVENPLDHDVWVRAIDFLPGERTVLHHIIANVGAGAWGGTALSNYVPGAAPLQIPADNGILLKKGTTFHFQMHYTPTGKELTDVTRMGLYFMKDPPKYSYRNSVFINPRMKIPANTKAHTETATQTFKRDVLIYSLHPHAHFRGRSASFKAFYPDGREELLLSVPRYDFNWQSTYELATPKILPAGTRVVYTSVFDNSTQNKANPDHNRVVPFGEQTWDEMVYAVIRYRYLEEDAALTSAQATK